MPYKDREKQLAYLAKHYKTNKGKYAEASKRTRARRIDRMRALKNAPCTDCDVKYPYYVMQWDHVGTDKIMDVARLSQLKAWQTVLDEIAKCELVCANCHAERTHQRLQQNITG